MYANRPRFLWKNEYCLVTTSYHGEFRARLYRLNDSISIPYQAEIQDEQRLISALNLIEVLDNYAPETLDAYIQDEWNLKAIKDASIYFPSGPVCTPLEVIE